MIRVSSSELFDTSHGRLHIATICMLNEPTDEELPRLLTQNWSVRLPVPVRLHGQFEHVGYLNEIRQSDDTGQIIVSGFGWWTTSLYGEWCPRLDADVDQMSERLSPPLLIMEEWRLSAVTLQPKDERDLWPGMESVYNDCY